MQTKTYRAPNMLAALQEIQRDLGPNAIVLSMREVTSGPSWQVWNKPGVEVVATTEMPARKSEPRESVALARDSEENVPGRKEIEALLTALAAKRGTPVREPEKAEKAVETAPAGAPQGISREPVRWTPPTLQKNKPGADTEPRRSNQALEVLDEVVDEIMEEARPQEKPAEVEESYPPLLKLIRHRLLRQGMDANLVEHLVDTNLHTLSPAVLGDEGRLTRFMMKQLEASLRPQKNNMAIIQNRVMCLIGATGSGKTSTCAKLAAYYTRTLGKKVVWICADTIRAGAISETRMYAEALEVPHFFAYTPQELGELITTQTDADLILVDTPGINTLDEDRVMELGTYLNEIPSRSIFVTAPATTKSTDLTQMISTLSLFKIKGLIVTKMDETYTYGDIYNVVLNTHLPVMYFTSGTQVLGKLHQGEPAKLVAAIFGEGI